MPPKKQKIERMCQLDQDQEDAKLDTILTIVKSCAFDGEGYVH